MLEDISGNPYVYHSVAHTGISITSDGAFNYVAIRAMAKYATDIMSVSVTQNGTPLTLSATVDVTVLPVLSSNCTVILPMLDTSVPLI